MLYIEQEYQLKIVPECPVGILDLPGSSMRTRAAPSIILISTFGMYSGCDTNGSKHSNHFMPRIGARHDFHEQRRHPHHFPETGKIYTYGRTAGNHSEDWKP